MCKWFWTIFSLGAPESCKQWKRSEGMHVNKNHTMNVFYICSNAWSSDEYVNELLQKYSIAVVVKLDRKQSNFIFNYIHTFISVTPKLGSSVTIFNYNYIITTYELTKKKYHVMYAERNKWINIRYSSESEIFIVFLKHALGTWVCISKQSEIIHLSPTHLRFRLIIGVGARYSSQCFSCKMKKK